MSANLKILLATDFSTRSDQALQRAVLLARGASADLAIVHVVDDDLPSRLLESEQREASALLGDLVKAVAQKDGVSCVARVVLGDPFLAISEAAEDLGADLIVMGPHRRKILRDIFVGTTVERTIRESVRPVIMANAAPSAPYRRVLIATDFSDASANAMRAADRLGLLTDVDIVLFNAFDAPAQDIMLRASPTTQELNDYIAGEKTRASGELADFARKIELKPMRQVVELADSSAAQSILKSANRLGADLIVIGARGRSAVGRFFLGGVAESVLRHADRDVLVVPPIMDHQLQEKD
ncbi:MAG: universal stress protein [Amphiplicatus sp.]